MKTIPLAVAAVLLSGALAQAQPKPQPLPSPQRYLAQVRSVFRSHRPPPPFVTYTLVRDQLNDQGFRDYVWSYTYHIWCRTSDRAALGRKVFRDTARGPLEFMRPAFNEPRDPGPPTADLFEPAPKKSRPIEFVPTPEPVETPLRVIGTIQSVGEFDYNVEFAEYEGASIHLRLKPIRDPERNRLRDLYADRSTFELKKIIATDRLYIQGGPSYRETFTVTLSMLEGRPVVTEIHGTVDGAYVGDGATVDYHFRDIAFPASLPEWYFNPKSYGAHANEAPL